MASGRKGQSDITLGGGHVAGIFLGVVVLCGIFFALGYVMGRNRSSGLLPAVSTSKTSPVNANGELTTGKGAPASTGWDFYPRTSASGKRLDSTPGLTPAKPVAAIPTPAPPAPRGPIAMQPRPAHLEIVSRPPALAGGRPGISLQVAAMRNRTDALALAGFLKKKGYPAFAWGPGSGRLFRVQVGPYRDAKAAETARRQLEHEGFKSILKK
jgi:cell division septation protein DedD